MDNDNPKELSIAEDFKEFLYILAHDFSAPLRGIVEFSKLIKMEEMERLSDDGKEYLAMILESGEKMQQMLAGLLEFSRLNTMAKPLSKVDCNKVVENCQIILSKDIIAQNAVIKVRELPIIMADADQLMQLFLILLDNALKFRGPNEVLITISAQLRNNEWSFNITDNGIGVSSEYRERIFLPFRKLNPDQVYPGLGLGLALARKIVKRHGGIIDLDNSVTTGTSVVFTIPQLQKN